MCCTAGAAGGKRLRHQIGNAERRPRRRRAEPRRHRLGRKQKGAIGRERRERLLVAREQAADPLAQRQIRTGRFVGRDQNGGIIAQRDARAGASERAAKACAEAAQTLKPRFPSGGNVAASRVISR